MRLTFSEFAIADQDDMATYTFGRWGQAQLDDYLGGLIDLFDLIAENRTFGRAVPNRRRDFRRIVYRSHLVFYIVGPGPFRIECILDQRLDHQRHLR